MDGCDGEGVRKIPQEDWWEETRADARSAAMFLGLLRWIGATAVARISDHITSPLKRANEPGS
jgi:hypothetical protein